MFQQLIHLSTAKTRCGYVQYEALLSAICYYWLLANHWQNSKNRPLPLRLRRRSQQSKKRAIRCHSPLSTKRPAGQVYARIKHKTKMQAVQRKSALVPLWRFLSAWMRMRRAIKSKRPAAIVSWLKCCLSAPRTMKQRKSRRQIRWFLKRKVVVRTTSLVRRKRWIADESTSANLGGGELGDGLGAFGDGVLGEFTGEDN